MKNIKNFNKEQLGITLIALVITIIILIILATITINAVFGDNGLIQQAEHARDLSANSTQSEYEGLNRLVDEYANLITEDNQKNGELVVNVSVEDNVVENLNGKVITIKDNQNQIINEYVLEEGENSHTFYNLEKDKEYVITMDELENEHYVFNIPNAEIVLEENSEVSLQYEYTRMYLYKEGDFCQEITGGYEEYELVTPSSPGRGYGTANVESDGGIVVQRTSGDNYRYGTKNAIDISKFSKIYIDATMQRKNNNSGVNFTYDKIGSTTNRDYMFQGFVFYSIGNNIDNYPLNVRTNMAFDLEEATKEVYLHISVYGDIVKVYNIYLEK